MSPTVDACGGTQGGAWAANTISGGTSGVVQACQQGITYTITYTTKQSSTGKTASAAVTVKVNSIPAPTASLTANGATNIGVNTGDNVSYAWSSTGADSASSTVTMSPTVDACGGVQGGAWAANTISGTTSGTVQSCQAGITYTITYTVKQSSTGRTASAQITVAVNQVPAPTAALTANGTSSITVNPGDNVTYAWSSSNADTASSSLTMSPTVDACGTAQGAAWVASTVNGGTTAAAQNCQAGITYAITYTVKQSSTGRTASSTVNVKVNSIPAPTASLTANGSNNITVNVGDSVGYVWSATNADSASSSVTMSPGVDTCGGTQGGAWAANNLSGGTSGIVQGCQSGITYTITYTAKQSSTGRTASSAVTIRVNAVPMPAVTSFTANGGTNITVNVGDTVNYAWASSNADSASSTVNMSPGVDACGGTQGGAWAANSVNGGTSGVVQNCQAGITYTITYTVRQSSTGRTASSSVTVRVNANPAPTASFTANGGTSITVNPGDTVNYAWSSAYADSASSSVTMSPTVDACGGTQGGAWVANTISGGTSGVVQTCQQGITYTITYTARQSSTGRTASAAVTIRVNAIPAPTASFLANGTTYLSVNPGAFISYSWSSANADSASSSVTMSPGVDSCGGTQGGAWAANTLTGGTSGTVQNCQAGTTYTITYTVRQSSTGRTASAAVTIQVNAIPAPVVNYFTANGTTNLSVNPNTFINYSWSSSNADSASSSVTQSPTMDTCGGGYQGMPWAANTISGGTSGTTQNCQAGITYTITYTVRQSSTGRTASATIYVRVNPLPNPTASLTANGSTYVYAPAGTYINYSWSSSNADGGRSYVYTNRQDACGTVSGSSWVANSAFGSTGGTVASCQSGTTYTIYYYSTRSSPAGTSSPAIITIAVP
jgi:putative lipoic acid-binding regulatory protein